MAVTSAQTIAAAGLVNGEGITTNQDMTAQFNTVDAKPLVISIDKLYTPTIGPNTISNVSGLSTTVMSIPRWVHGRTGTAGYIKVSAQATAQAGSIVGSGQSGIKNFALTLNQTGSYGSASLDWAASVDHYNGKSFTDFGLQNKGYQDIASGGTTGTFSSLKTAPGGIQNAMQDFGSFLKRMGNAFNVTDLTQTFAPASFIKNLRKQGLGNVGDLNYKLAAQGIYSDADLDKADPAVLRRTMDTVTAADVQKVVDSTNMQLPPGTKLEKLSDLLNAKKILPTTLQGMAPSGDMADVNKVVGPMGGKFKSTSDIGNYLGKSEVPEYDKLNALSSPLPPAYIATLSPYIGKVPMAPVDGVTQTLGTGPLGNPTVKDMMGSAAGTGFTDNFKKISAAHDSVMNSQIGQDLLSALDALWVADKNNSPTGIYKVELENAIANFNIAVANSPEIKAAQTAMSGSVLQINRESGLLPLAGVDLANPPVVPGVTGVLNLAKNLPKYGEDKQNLGYKDVMAGVADKNSVTGQAIMASLMEGRNRARQQSAGIPDNISADSNSILSNSLAAKKASGLTDLQKQNITADCKVTGADPKYVIQNAENFGYNNAYYVKKGYPSAD